jgi:hypothetical protein
MGVIPKRDQRGDVAIGHQPDIAAAATVTAIGTTPTDIGLTTEGHTTGAPVAAPHVEAALVDELGHGEPA